ncbi:MAG: TetR/AcrR family transcriptional regulator [Gammaproteobacteria bacterium]|jgi:AcrR family transcriptional regulator|nr:TetR/AcrR family transcriptional regulator [Gammaproteobacteria bacterium]MDH5172986.1 TetR/AcrR family transcriptional regulator [Gammaproteobacteria bacterium]
MEGKIYRPHFTTASDARVVRTRDSLRRALLELLQSRSFEQITIREIAATAGIGYTTFFRHHPTRESLLEEIAADEMRQLLEHLLSTFDADDTRAQSLALCQYVADHRAVWSTLLTGGAAGTLREEFIRIAKAVAEGSPHNTRWLPAEVGIILVASGTIELLAWWLQQRRPLSVQKVATIYERAVLSPIFQSYGD